MPTVRRNAGKTHIERRTGPVHITGPRSTKNNVGNQEQLGLTTSNNQRMLPEIEC